MRAAPIMMMASANQIRDPIAWDPTAHQLGHHTNCCRLFVTPESVLQMGSGVCACAERKGVLFMEGWHERRHYTSRREGGGRVWHTSRSLPGTLT